MMRESGRFPFGLWVLRGMWASVKSIRRILLHESGKADKLFAILQGWRDGMTGRMGKRGKTSIACPDQHIARF